MGKYLFDRSKDEGGFNVIELALYMLILTVILSTAVLGFEGMRKTSLLNNSTMQIKVAMDHALNIAKNENQKVQLKFYSSASAGHPNTYAYFKADNSQEKPASGTSYYTEAGVYYIKLLGGDSGVTVAGDVTVEYNPQGTILTVTSTNVVISYSGSSRTIAVNTNGEVTY